MKSRRLLLALQALLTAELGNYPFPSPDPMAPSSDVRVFFHGLPDGQDGEGYPFVVIRWVEGRIEENETQTLAFETVGLVLGVYAPKNQEQAGILTSELLDVVRQILWSNRQLEQLFDLVPPLRATIPGPKEKWNQYHLASVEAEWNYVLPGRGLGKHGAEYGFSTGFR